MNTKYSVYAVHDIQIVCATSHNICHEGKKCPYLKAFVLEYYFSEILTCHQYRNYLALPLIVIKLVLPEKKKVIQEFDSYSKRKITMKFSHKNYSKLPKL